MAPALEKPTVLFLTVPGGRTARMTGACRTADWLLASVSFTRFIPPRGAQGVPFGIIVYGRKPSNDKPRLQVPCRGGRPAGTAAAATTLHRHDGASQRMHVSVPSLLLPSCCSGSPSFLFVVWIIFKPLILFVCRVLKKERHSAMSESSGWCGRQGGASKMSNTCTILYHLWNMYKKRCTFWNNKYLFDFWILASCSLKQNQKETDFPGIVAGKIFFSV